MMLYICVKLHENITNGIRVMERNEYMVEMAMFNVRRVITPKVDKSELRFMCSAHCLMVLYVCVKLNLWKCLKGYQNYGADMKLWCAEGQTDGHSKFLRVEHNTSQLFVMGHKNLRSKFYPLTDYSRETRKRVLGKQCRPRSDLIRVSTVCK